MGTGWLLWEGDVDTLLKPGRRKRLEILSDLFFIKVIGSLKVTSDVISHACRKDHSSEKRGIALPYDNTIQLTIGD